MNTGAWACGILACIFGILVIILSLLKEKGAMLVSGFNTLSKKQRDMYDSAAIAKDTRNQFFIWTCIMLIENDSFNTDFILYGNCSLCYLEYCVYQRCSFRCKKSI